MTTTRAALRAQGEAMRSRLFGAAAPAVDWPGVDDLMSEAVYGTVWCRPGLALPDRMVAALAALGALVRLPALGRHVDAALDLGLERRAIGEVLLQAGLYAGFAGAEETLAAANAVFAARGLAPLAPERRDDALHSLTARGRELMESLHGERAYQGYAAGDNPVTGAMYPLAIQYGYGELWFRPGLERRQRALVAVAAFTALRLEGQVRKFGQSALGAGLSAEEVREAVIQTAPYGGFPPALNALAALSDVLGPLLSDGS